jgi:ferric-dicitrate binding protein FerR (iron transport regulator)
MMDKSRSHQLIESHLDQCASAAELGELDQLLAASPEAVGAFVHAARLEASLTDYFIEAGTVTTMEVRSRPKIRPRRAALLKGLVAALLVLAAGGPFVFGPEHVAPNDLVSGRVLIDGVEAASIPAGSRFEVAGDTAAVIRLADDSRAELAPDTQAVLRGRVGGRPEVVELDKGKGNFQVGKAGRGFRVDTPVGTITGRNTEFSVELRPTDETGVEPMSEQVALLLAVAVLAGDVEVRSKGQSYVVARGESYLFAAEQKGTRKIPTLTGKVTAVSADGKRITLETPPPKPGAEPRQQEIKITDRTELAYYGVEKDGDRPTVGYLATVLLDGADSDTATRVQFGVKEAQVNGRVIKVAADGKLLTLEIYGKGERPTQAEVKLTDRSRLMYTGIDKEGAKPTVGYAAQVWLKEGTKDTAAEVRFLLKKKAVSQPIDEPKVKKPFVPDTPKPLKTSKGADSAPTTKPAPAAKAPQRPSTRDPRPVAAAIDREVDKRLTEARVPASPPADDAEFLRRVTLDLIGRIPTYEEATSFLNSADPDKRRHWIDQLLDGPEYGLHFGAVWRNLLVPRDATKGGKTQADKFSPWLAEQLNRNRGWNEIVYDLLTIEGDIAQHPESAFVIANSENFQPQADRLAAATARYFLGVQLQCAQCHNHPFAAWKQTDFWSTAAFFGRLHGGSKKGPPFILTEAPQEEPSAPGKKGAPVRPPVLPGAAIQIPGSSGAAAGRVVKARFLSGEEPALDDNAPYRPRFAAWVTSADNPFFAKAAVNRLWALCFGRGLVNPVDNLHDGNPASHPALLELLANELRASGYDLKHLMRCLCTSVAYQCTSRPLPGNESDAQLFSHMAVKVMTPEVFYDSLATAMAGGLAPVKKGSKSVAGKSIAPNLESREQFVNAFGAQGEPAEAGEFSYGIPQFLKLMNAGELNHGAPVVARLVKDGAAPEKAIEDLYLTVLSRRPNESEVKMMGDYLRKRGNAENGYAGVLWTLLNSSEFVLNH